ncbi:MAG: S8 family serine peptidase [bacterium]|nr:S8 family serine peptidase [bacterium]
MLSADSPSDVERQLYVELEPGARIAEVAAMHDLAVVEGVAAIHLWTVEVGADADLGQVEDDLSDDPRVQNIEAVKSLEIPEDVQRSIPDLGISISVDDLPGQEAIAVLGAAGAHQRFTGAGIRVAVLDSGVALNHPLLAGALLGSGVDLVDHDACAAPHPEGVDADGDGWVDEGVHHGTYVAGLIRLAAPGARILPIRVLDAEGHGSVLRVVEGLRRAAASGARVINLSFEMLEESNLVKDAIAELVADGVVVVAAAGNRSDSVVGFPAKQPETIAVAAVDPNLIKSEFSNYGSEINLSAPGEQVYSSYGDGVARWDGTSFATPLVSAAAAILLEKYPGLDADRVREMILEAVQPDNGPSDYSGNMGEGVLDLSSLVEMRSSDRTSLKLHPSPGGTRVSWSEVDSANRYDLVRGMVGDLELTSDGAASVLSAATCLADGVTAQDGLNVVDAAEPDPGQPFYYLFADDAADRSGFDLPDHGVDRIGSGGACSGSEHESDEEEEEEEDDD